MNRRYILPIVSLVFALMFSAGLYVINLVEDQYLREHKNVVAELGRNYATFVQLQLERSLSSTYALSSILRQNDGELPDFDHFAADLLDSYGGITNLQLAPDAVVSHIYPLEGNEKAIGHDLLADEKRRHDTLAAIESRRLTLAGPFELIQGGTAMVGRLPVFLQDENGNDEFWGLTIALIRMPGFLKASGLDQIEKEGFSYELSRLASDSGQEQVFLPARHAMVDPVETIFSVPNGEWKLSLEPIDGWRRSPASTYSIIVLFVVCLLTAFMIYFILRQPVNLQRRIDVRTSELARANRLLHEEIRERTNAEEALRASDARVRAIIETAPNGIVILNETLAITSINPAALRMFRYEFDEMIEQSFALLVPDSVEVYESKIANGKATTIHNTTCEVTAYRKDGEEFPIELTCNFVRLDEDEFYALVVRDLTSSKEMDRLRNEFVATVSHELRTPLAAVMGFLETVLSEKSGALNEIQRRHLRMSYTASTRLSRHVEELLTVSKIQQGRLRLERKNFDPEEAIESAMNVIEPLAQTRSITVHTFLEHESEHFVGDQERLEQVLINLVSNAVKFTPEHGHVSVHSKMQNGRWHFCIEDTGIGIAADEVEQVFNRFQRGQNAVDDQIQGAGLGLYICRIIVEAHNGTISLDSVLGKGTTVTVMLPVGDQGAVAEPEYLLQQA